jgi:hypothetical protein
MHENNQKSKISTFIQKSLVRMRVDTYRYVFVCKKKIYKQPPPLTHTQALMQMQQENNI